jgi:electron transfer flavoprotein alpha subunit
VKKAEDLKLIQELAAVIGAQLGGSRPLTEDLKWLPADAQVGLSGKKVKPKLYVACGISGQIQHIVGMRDAQTIVAINMDPSAPIFEEADYCIVGDLYKIVPALTAAFRELLRK